MDNQNAITATPPPAPAKFSKGVLFQVILWKSFILSFLLLFITIVLSLTLSADFYIGVIKSSNFLKPLIKARAIAEEKTLNAKVEEKFQVKKKTAAMENARAAMDNAKSAWEKQSRAGEIKSIKAQIKTIDAMEFKSLPPGKFASEDKFEDYQEAEIKKLKKQIDEIEEYQDKNEKAIDNAEDAYDEAKDKFEDALDELNDAKEDAADFVADTKDQLLNTIFDDLEKIEPKITPLINDFFIEGNLKTELAKILNFISDYPAALDAKRVQFGDAPGGRLRILLPEIQISLFVNDTRPEFRRKRHLITEVIKGEIDSTRNLKNSMLFSLFALSDSSLVEYFGARFLRDYNIQFAGQTITIKNFALDGDAADGLRGAMIALTIGKHSVFLLFGVLLFTVLYVIFARLPREYKLRKLRAVFLYPSIGILLLCFAALWASQNLVATFPALIDNVLVREYFSSLGFTIVSQIFLPLGAVFTGLLLIGVFYHSLYRRLLRREARRE